MGSRPARSVLPVARRSTTAALALVCAIAAATAPAQEPLDDVARAIRAIIDAAWHPDLRWPRFPDYRDAMARAYQRSGQQPLWLHDGAPSAQAGAVIDALRDADARGLSAADYDGDWLLAEHRRLTQARADAAQLARFDTALTVSLMRFVSDSYNGRIDPRLVGWSAEAAPKPLDLADVVLELSRGADPSAHLAELQPHLAIYARLTSALASMRALAARPDLRAPALSATLRPGARDPAVPELRTFLGGLADLPPDASLPADPRSYDDALAAAVQRFQRRHGLAPDAVIGAATRRALAVPLAQRIEQIRLALERIRWLPERFPEPFIIVNIPAFRLLAFEHEASGPRLTMEVVVGSAASQHFTPVLHAEMRYLIFGPFWDVPRSIARREMLPILERDPEYLARQDLEIVGPSGVLPPTPQSLDLVAAGAARLRQRPGPRNALGRVKFIFPNRRGVYLHDTPARRLFARSRRDFSHGCIRVADPLGLAEFVLAGQAGWDRERILAAMRDAHNRRVDLDQPVPVYLLYSTAVVSQGGDVLFFEDIYDYDAQLARLLAGGYPYPGPAR